MIGRPRILVVEPAHVARHGIGEALVRRGYQPCGSPSLADAFLRNLVCGPFVCLVTAWELPDGTARALLDELVPAAGNPSVVGIAGGASERHAFHSLGVAHVVERPVDAAALALAVEALVGPVRKSRKP